MLIRKQASSSGGKDEVLFYCLCTKFIDYDETVLLLKKKIHRFDQNYFKLSFLKKEKDLILKFCLLNETST